MLGPGKTIVTCLCDSGQVSNAGTQPLGATLYDMNALRHLNTLY